jgi:hypothetical protein
MDRVTGNLTTERWRGQDLSDQIRSDLSNREIQYIKVAYPDGVISVIEDGIAGVVHLH